MDDDDLASMDMNWIDRYEQRDIAAHPELAQVSLLQVFRRYDWRAGKFVLRPSAKPRVVNIRPVYKPDKSDPAMYESYCRAKLQLHHPYVLDVETLQRVGDEDIG